MRRNGLGLVMGVITEVEGVKFGWLDESLGKILASRRESCCMACCCEASVALILTISAS